MNGPLKQKQTVFSAKKMTEKTKQKALLLPWITPIQKWKNPFPPVLRGLCFSPPEEHQIAHLLLNGVPLIILDEEREPEKLLYLLGPLTSKEALSPMGV